MAINIVTKDFTGTNQLTGQITGGWQQDKYGEGHVGGNFIYNHGKLSMDVSYTYTNGTGFGQVEHEANHLLNGERKTYSDNTQNRSDGIDHKYRIGIDYAIADNHSLSLAYTGQWNSTHSTNTKPFKTPANTNTCTMSTPVIQHPSASSWVCLILITKSLAHKISTVNYTTSVATSMLIVARQSGNGFSPQTRPTPCQEVGD